MGAEHRGSPPASDGWNVLLGLAVVTLTTVSAFGWMEMRRLDQRIGRLETPSTAAAGAPLAGPAASVDQEAAPFARINASITIRDAAFKGNTAAPIVIVEFSDFECPFCARHFRDTLKRLDETYIATGKVRYVFRHLPLEQIHARAVMAAEIAECSRRQGLFWQIHDRFFRMQRGLRELDLRAQATAIGVDAGPLEDCLNESGRGHVLADLADARRLGIAGTPFFFIGRPAAGGLVAATHSINGARAFEVFEHIIAEVMRSSGTE